MEHKFNVELAKAIGVHEAVIINNFQFWIAKNKANDKHFHEGKYWTYNSASAMSEIFPYLSESQIRRIMNDLAEKEIIYKGNFNTNPYDKTMWYAINEDKVSMLENRFTDVTISSHRSDESNTSITDNNQQIKKPNKKPNKKQFDAFAFMCGLGFESDLVTEYLDIRKKKRLVSTARAFEAIVDEINKTAMDKNEVLKIILIKGWGGFEAEWIQKSKPKPNFDVNIRFANYLPSSFFKAEYDCEDRIEAIKSGKLPTNVTEMLNVLDAVLRQKYGRTAIPKLQWN